MKMTKLLAIFLAVSLLLCGCGAESNGAMTGSAANKGAYAEYDGVMDAESSKDEGLVKDTDTGVTALPVDQKLIRKIWLDAETENMEPLLQAVEDRIAQLQGYVEARQIRNGSAYSGKRYRYAELTVRIPAQQLDAFVDSVEGACNITDTRETTDDVTLSYVENESRVVALETEQTRLLELLAKAESMEDILKIESRLTEIREQLEQVKSRLRLYDNQVNYGTVYLTVTEVKEYTPVEEPETLWERMGAGLSDSWKDMLTGMGDFLVWLTAALPHLLPWGLVAAVVVLIVRSGKKKKAKKNPPKPPEEK